MIGDNEPINYEVMRLVDPFAGFIPNKSDLINGLFFLISKRECPIIATKKLSPAREHQVLLHFIVR
jgi:hypothetical protein